MLEIEMSTLYDQKKNYLHALELFFEKWIDTELNNQVNLDTHVALTFTQFLSTATDSIALLSAP